MAATLKDLRPVHVVGIGLHRYQRLSETPYVELGLTAVRAALTDAGIDWTEVESAHVGSAVLGMAPGRAMLRYLGATGLSIARAENASASGSTAFRQACLEVAAGIADVAIAIGIDKPGSAAVAGAADGIERLVQPGIPIAAGFALMAEDYMRATGATPEQIAAVAVKNHNNAARNPFAQFQQQRTLDGVMSDPPIAGCLTRLQCCPFGEGAAAVIVVSDDAIERLGIDRGRAARVIGSVSRSERVYGEGQPVALELTRETARQAFEEAEVAPRDLDVVELHDAFSIEELVYTEALGLCGAGEAADYLTRGASAIGGDCAISPSGGLLGMGHPFGPTGVGQIVEITRQLRGEAGDRQQPGARLGLAHMVGIGQVCVVHVLAGPSA